MRIWPFLISRTNYTDYQSIVIPDFMQGSETKDILDALTIGSVDESNFVYLRCVDTKELGQLIFFYKVGYVRAKEIENNKTGLLLDKFSRPIQSVKGGITKEISWKPLISEGLIENIYTLLEEPFKDFWYSQKSDMISSRSFEWDSTLLDTESNFLNIINLDTVRT